MGGTTAAVRSALNKLGWDASNQKVKEYLQENEPQVPQGHISLALRKLRAKEISGLEMEYLEEMRLRVKKPKSKPIQGTLFPDQ